MSPLSILQLGDDAAARLPEAPSHVPPSSATRSRCPQRSATCVA
eukprot:CAMPEP_0195123954 /NCGR_PEP_ID=MMETSP0448-20130528/129743_1 /TAXON_ID=66468 /ORGANISM="Heterocapsa triquestra, Strain CCMP 448" /LENGTH=43 /DNA_ID= /DNA_START= /DNA_END= /DNA_ORIENTATION=